MKQFLFVALAAAGLLAGGSAAADTALFKAGQSSFESKCAMCHNIDPAAGHAVGPNLHGVVGRKAAAASGFNYSPGLQQVKGDWDPARLNVFLQNPQAFAPGNVMPFAGLKNDKERKAVICYLSGQPDGAACAM